ncbi:MAG: hypothetical protein ACJATL_001183, partial [Rickettsiales bacterium]
MIAKGNNPLNIHNRAVDANTINTAISLYDI